MLPFQKLLFTKMIPLLLYNKIVVNKSLFLKYSKLKHFSNLCSIGFSRHKSSFKRSSSNSQIDLVSCKKLFGTSNSLQCSNNIHSNEIKGNERVSNEDQLKDDYVCQNLSHVLKRSLILEDLTSSNLSLITERFGLKGLNIDYIYEHGIKISPDLNSLIFPFDSLDKKFSAIQFIFYDKTIGKTKASITSSKDGNDLLFGWSSIGLSQKEIVIVSNPLDAVAVNQETDLPVVSLSCSASYFSSKILFLLKSFQKVTFWLKPEWHSTEIHYLLSQSLGRSAFFVRPQEYPCALACLQSGLKVRHILREADPIYHEGVDTIDLYRNILYERFKNHERHSGAKWIRFSALNEILKGLRKRELTIFTGQTGTGKTTLMSEYSLDLCMQGLPTLWASFEISNERLLETMLCQYAQCALVENIEEFHYWFDKFEKLPMYILNIHGRKSLKGMLQAMKTYVRAFNVQHVVVDNLQFLMNIENYGSMIDQYRRQDEIFGAFRGFATRCDCHVTLVIHPRKEPEFTELNNASISGTAKATQEADNILILQTTKTRQYLHITKNRYAGIKGCVIVEFDKNSQTFKQKKLSSTFEKEEQKKVL